MQTATITRSRPFFWTYPLAPLLATLHYRLRLCLRGRGNGDGDCEGIGTYPLAPFLRGRGNGERFCEGLYEVGLDFHGVIHSPKAIRIARDANLQKAMRSPFPRRKGGRGDRSMAVGVIRAIRLIRLIRY